MLWRNVNWASFLIVHYGTIRAELHDIACDIFKICKDNQIELKVEWMSREEEQIKFCDKMNKDWHGSEYRK